MSATTTTTATTIGSTLPKLTPLLAPVLGWLDDVETVGVLVVLVVATAVYSKVELKVVGAAVLSATAAVTRTLYVPVTFHAGPPAGNDVVKLEFCAGPTLFAATTAPFGWSIWTRMPEAKEGATPLTNTVVFPV